MPLIDFIHHTDNTKVVVWQVSETNEELLCFLKLNDRRIIKYSNLTTKKQKEFLGLRACLKILNLDDDVNYDTRGKPHLSNNHNISITHSHGMVAVGVSINSNIGVDIELERVEKIINIKTKFVGEDESLFIPKHEEHKYLHIIWGIKESLYKLYHGDLWNFVNHYKVQKFSLTDIDIKCWIMDGQLSSCYTAYYKYIDGYYLVYVLD